MLRITTSQLKLFFFRKKESSFFFNAMGMKNNIAAQPACKFLLDTAVF